MSPATDHAPGIPASPELLTIRSRYIVRVRPRAAGGNRAGPVTQRAAWASAARISAALAGVPFSFSNGP